MCAHKHKTFFNLSTCIVDLHYYYPCILFSLALLFHAPHCIAKPLDCKVMHNWQISSHLHPLSLIFSRFLVITSHVFIKFVYVETYFRGLILSFITRILNWILSGQLLEMNQSDIIDAVWLPAALLSGRPAKWKAIGERQEQIVTAFFYSPVLYMKCCIQAVVQMLFYWEWPL